MTNEEQTEHTLPGLLSSVLEISNVIDVILLPVSLFSAGAKFVGKEALKEGGEEAAKAAGKNLSQMVGKEVLQEVGEKGAKELAQVTTEKAMKEVAVEGTERAAKELADETRERLVKDAVDTERLITGEDWNNYFREQYGYDNVNWDTAFSSPNDIIDTPSSITRMNPNGLNEYLTQNGIETKPLGQGSLSGVPYENGGGFHARYNSNYGEAYVQYHPGNGHHGEGAYYKVSLSNTFSYYGNETGTQRFHLDGTVMKNDEK